MGPARPNRLGLHTFLESIMLLNPRANIPHGKTRNVPPSSRSISRGARNEFFFSLFQSRRRAEKLGRLCLFYEAPVEDDDSSDERSVDLVASDEHAAPTASPPPLHLRIRSAHDPDWYLGFNRRRKRMAHLPR